MHLLNFFFLLLDHVILSVFCGSWCFSNGCGGCVDGGSNGDCGAVGGHGGIVAVVMK